MRLATWPQLGERGLDSGNLRMAFRKVFVFVVHGIAPPIHDRLLRSVSMADKYLRWAVERDVFVKSAISSNESPPQILATTVSRCSIGSVSNCSAARIASSRVSTDGSNHSSRSEATRSSRARERRRAVVLRDQLVANNAVEPGNYVLGRIVRLDAADQLQKGLLNDILGRRIGPLPREQQQRIGVRIDDLGHVFVGKPFGHPAIFPDETVLFNAAMRFASLHDNRPRRGRNIPRKMGDGRKDAKRGRESFSAGRSWLG